MNYLINKIFKKKQEKVINESRSVELYVILAIILVSIYIKIGLNSNWHLNDVIIEIVCLFTVITLGMFSNIKNGYPIFNFKNFKITSTFAYSLTSFFIMLLIFVIYKNITEPDFIRYIAGLKFHDLCTLLVFLAPISVIILFIIYKSFKAFVPNEKEIALFSNDDNVCTNMNFINNTIILTLFISIWIKIGFNNLPASSVITELIIFFGILIVRIIYHKKEKLPIFYVNRDILNKHFIFSLLLPYIIIILFALLNSSFRADLLNLNSNNLLSLIIYIFPLLLVMSILFYYGSSKEKSLSKEFKLLLLKKNRNKKNALIALLITILLGIIIFIYMINLVNSFNFKNVAHILIVLLPLLCIIFLIIFSSVKEMNK